MAMSEIMLNFSENPDKVSIVLLNINMILSEKGHHGEGSKEPGGKGTFES